MRFADCRPVVCGAVAVIVTSVALRADAPPPVQRQRVSMGTVFSIVAWHASPAVSARAAEAALDEVVRLDGVLSHYKPESELSRLNREGGRGFVTVGPDLFRVIETALEFSRRSGGAFDITVGPLIRVWREAYEAGHEPTPDAVAAAARCVGHELIGLSPPDRIRFRSDCVRLDLGGIGKGYAVERAIAVLKAAGIANAVVNAGGSTIGAIGAPPGKDGWPVVLGDGADAKTIVLRDAALSTSQQSLRPIPFGRGGFGEIIDPKRRTPIPPGTVVSAIVPDATEADALSTTLLLLPVEEGKRLLDQFPSATAFWISPDGELRDSYGESQRRLAVLR